MIGGGKCGTTSLHHYLDLHPEIQMSHPKELRFFADRPSHEAGPPLADPVDHRLLGNSIGTWRQGEGWYRRKFDPEAPVRGESSPIYSNPWHPDCPERMASTLTDPHLVLVVRDLVERAISQYRYARAGQRDPRPPEQALAPNGYIANCGRASQALVRYRELFGADRVLVIAAEDLKRDTAGTMARVFAHAGAESGFRSPGFERRWNAGDPQRGARWGLLLWARRLPGWWRVSGLPPKRMLWAIERATTARSREPGSEPDLISEQVRQRLREGLADEAAQIRELTGMRLEHWSI